MAADTLELPIHPEYQAMAENWHDCRCAIAGEAVIKQGENRQRYLPRPLGIKSEDYPAYLLRANWFGASGRAVEGLLGTIIRKPPQVEGVKVEDLVDFGRYGETFYTLVRTALLEVLSVGREGILVDAPENGLADPFIVLYRTEDVLFWECRYDPSFRREMPVVVILREVVQEFDQQTWEFKRLERFRMLYIDPTDGQYYQRMYRAVDEDQHKTHHSSFTKSTESIQVVPAGPAKLVLMSGGRSLKYIPFYFQGVNEISPVIEMPPLLDLIKVNFSHYYLNADMHWALHMAALPTPWGRGIDDVIGESGKVVPREIPIGSSSFISIPNENAELRMLETTGNGIPSMYKELEKKERQMAVLGSRLLEESKGNTDVAEAIKMRLAGDSATLGSIALTASEVWTWVLRTYVTWRDAVADVSDIKVKINTDFNMRRMDSQEIIMLTTAFNEGAISFEVLHYNLQRGEIVPDGLTAEEHWKQIQAKGGRVTPETITQRPRASQETSRAA